jgi:hypothetical protein
MSMDYENIDDDTEYEIDDSSRDDDMELLPQDTSVGASPKPQSDGVVADDINNSSPVSIASITIVESFSLKTARGMSLQDDDDEDHDDDDEFEYE